MAIFPQPFCLFLKSNRENTVIIVYTLQLFGCFEKWPKTQISPKAPKETPVQHPEYFTLIVSLFDVPKSVPQMAEKKMYILNETKKLP
jgi:hypothetical protein